MEATRAEDVLAVTEQASARVRTLAKREGRPLPPPLKPQTPPPPPREERVVTENVSPATRGPAQ